MENKHTAYIHTHAAHRHTHSCVCINRLCQFLLHIDTLHKNKSLQLKRVYERGVKGRGIRRRWRRGTGSSACSMAAFCLLETATIPVSIFHYICHVTAHFSLFSVPSSQFPSRAPSSPAMLTNQRDTDTDTVYGSSSASCACTEEGGRESLWAARCYHCWLLFPFLLSHAFNSFNNSAKSCASNTSLRQQ